MTRKEAQKRFDAAAKALHECTSETSETDAQIILDEFDAATKGLCRAEHNSPTKKEMARKNNDLYIRNRGWDF